MKQVTFLLCLLLPFYAFAKSPRSSDSKPINLLDNNLSYWYKLMGVPHKTVTGLPAGTFQGSMYGTPMGKNNDPKDVFKVVTLDGEKVLRVSGEIYGGLTTKQEYGDYHFHLKYKWGKTKWAPRLNATRDMGIDFHCVGLDEDAQWGCYKECFEFQICEGSTAAVYLNCNKQNTSFVYADCRVGNKKWAVNAPERKYGGLGAVVFPSVNYESGADEWTTLDLYTVGGTSVYMVNGHVVNAFRNAELLKTDNTFVPLTKGQIQLQCEGAEGYYKDITIQPITDIPADIKKVAGLDIPRTWKLGVTTFTFHDFSLMETLLKVDSAGLVHLEVLPSQKIGGEFRDSMISQLSPAGLEKLYRVVTKAGFQMDCIYLFGGDADSWKKLFEMTKRLHIKHVTAEPSLNVLDAVDSLAGVYGLKVAIHNHYKGMGKFWDPDKVLAALKNHPNFGICADIGHWPKSGIDPVEALKKFEGRIFELHLKDDADFNNPKTKDLSLGKGVINFPAIVNELKRQKFDGYMIIERDESDKPSNLLSVIESVKYYNKVLGLQNANNKNANNK
jgi:L-ribulose-5-phosphate 3-epimerase